MTSPKVPPGLAARGRAFWRRTVASYVLSETEVELLGEVCRLLDECDALRSVVAADGVTVAGSAGQPRVHPALGELRQHRLAVGRLLAQLALPGDEEGTLDSPARARARRAAAARWSGHIRRDVRGFTHGAAGPPRHPRASRRDVTRCRTVCGHRGARTGRDCPARCCGGLGGPRRTPGARSTGGLTGRCSAFGIRTGLRVAGPTSRRRAHSSLFGSSGGLGCAVVYGIGGRTS